MFNTPYNRKIKDEMIAIDKAYIKHSKKVSTKGLLNVSASGNVIGGGRLYGGALPDGVSPSLGRPIGGARTGGARTGGKCDCEDNKPSVKKSSPWIAHIKEFAKKNGINYREALRSPEAKASYKKVGGADPNRNLAYEGVKPKEVVYTEVKHKPDFKKLGKQLGAELVAKANADLAQSTPPTSATTAPRVISEDIMGTAGKLKGGYRTKGAVDKKPRKPSKWVAFVKEFASKRGVSYSCALSMPECKAEYRAPPPAEAPKKKRLVRKVKDIQ